jgi:glycosyltransferase involved in cell wall biosynthesis
VESVSSSHRILFDDRSAQILRTTGWERYARGLADQIKTWADPSDPQVTLLSERARGSLATRPLLGDALTWWHAKGFPMVHYPTFPPLAPRANFVVTLHDLAWWKHPDTASRLGGAWYRPQLVRHLAGARAIVTHTQSVADEASAWFDLPSERFHVVSPGVELPEPRAGWRVTDKPYVLAVGSIEPRKNLPALVRAYQASGLPAGDIDLVIAGRQAWGTVPAGVTVASGLDDAQITSCYHGALGLVLPSLCEGFGLPAVEALAAGCAVACSDLPELREVTGGHATYFDPYDDQAMSTALDQLVQSTATAAAIAHARSYTWSAAGAQLRSVYLSVCD